jgi:hypothetical protein
LTLRERGPLELYGSPTRSSWNCGFGNHDAMNDNGRTNGHGGQPTLHNPLGLLAELTHRCPLGCPYCSNPLAMDGREDELDVATWARVFCEAAGLGVLQVHLSGGEPASRRDLVDIMVAAHNAGLYTNLITSGVGVTDKRLKALADAGLDHVQISRTVRRNPPTASPVMTAPMRGSAHSPPRWLRSNCRSPSTSSSTAPISSGSATS